MSKPSAHARDTVTFVAGELDCSFTREQQLQAATVIDREAIAPAVAEATAPLVEALEWYSERAEQLANPVRSDDYMIAVITELELDGGTRARNALAPYRKQEGNP